MSTVAYRNANVDGIGVFYRESGPKEGPTILLLHGFPTEGHMFRDLIPQLADRFRLVAPDLPGFGQSDMPARGTFAYTFDNVASVINRFAEVIGRQCCKLELKTAKGPKLRVSRSHRDSEETYYDCGLAEDLIFWQPANLSFANHVHRFYTLDRSPRGLKRPEPLHGSNSSLDRPMVLLHHVVEIANWSTAAAPTEFPSPLELRNDPRISGVPVYVDDSRTWMVC